MTRKSLSITQEQLCDAICSAETLSRIENGNQNPSRDIYELLMERMGRIRERAYSILTISDFKVLEKMRLFEDYIKSYDYNQAESVLKEIKKSLGNSILDKQFLFRAESLVNYRLKRISSEEYLDGFIKAIKLTIPRFGTISLSNWPLSFNEAVLLINISIAYAEKEDYLNAIKDLNEAYSAMKQSYMEEQQRILLQVTMANNLSKWYGLIRKHDKAIEYANEGIELSKKFKLGNVLPNLLYSIAWNKEQLIELGVLSPESKKECIMYLKKAYYIASAMQLRFMVRFVEKHLIENYNISL
jgi:transcriptional regulator with XRE-family HTH domain